MLAIKLVDRAFRPVAFQLHRRTTFVHLPLYKSRAHPYHSIRRIPS